MHSSHARYDRQDSESEDAEGSSGRANDKGSGKDGEKKGVINRVNSESRSFAHPDVSLTYRSLRTWCDVSELTQEQLPPDEDEVCWRRRTTLQTMQNRWTTMRHGETRSK